MDEIKCSWLCLHEQKRCEINYTQAGNCLSISYGESLGKVSRYCELNLFVHFNDVRNSMRMCMEKFHWNNRF